MTLAKPQVETLLSELAEMEKITCSNCGGYRPSSPICKCCKGKGFKKIPVPVTIGRVLELMAKNAKGKEDLFFIKGSEFNEERDKLLYIWSRCGISKTLNQIVEESRWEVQTRRCECKECISGSVCDKADKYGDYEYEQLKDPNARALVEFIHSLNLNPTNAKD